MSLREFGVKAWLWENWRHCWQHSAFLLATCGSRKRQQAKDWMTCDFLCIVCFSCDFQCEIPSAFYLCTTFVIVELWFSMRDTNAIRATECHIFYAVTIPAAQEWTNLASSNSRSSLLTSPYRLQVLCCPISSNHIQNSRSSHLTSDLFLSSSNLGLSNIWH